MIEQSEKAGGSAMRRYLRVLWGILDEMITALDSQTIFAMIMIGLGIAIASAPDQGAAGAMAAIGVSPKFFALVLAFGGALIIRFGRYRVFALLTLPYVFYVVALIQYVLATTNSFAPVVVYFGTYLLALRLASIDTHGGKHD